MQTLGASVGEMGANARHDVALVQAVLVLARRPALLDPTRATYLARIDGDCGPRTKAALRKFQLDQVFVGPGGSGTAGNRRPRPIGISGMEPLESGLGTAGRFGPPSVRHDRTARSVHHPKEMMTMRLDLNCTLNSIATIASKIGNAQRNAPSPCTSGPTPLPTFPPTTARMRLFDVNASGPTSIAGQQRNKFTRIEAAPPGIAPLFHGTSKERAQAILESGFDVGQTGVNYAPSGQITEERLAGPYQAQGVFATTDRSTAELYAKNPAARATSGETAILALYPVQDENLVTERVPFKERCSLEGTRKFIREHPEVHQFLLSAERSPEQVSMFTRLAQDDPTVTIGFMLAEKADEPGSNNPAQ